MKIGIPKEIKTNENRVSLVPAGAEAQRKEPHGKDGEHRTGPYA